MNHSEGESLREEKKKRLGRNMPPQNGGFGGRAASCEGSEEHTIDQARCLGGPAQFTSWARSPWNLVRAVRSSQLPRRIVWADPTIQCQGLHLAITLLPIVARTSDS